MIFELHPDIVGLDLAEIAGFIAHDNEVAARAVLAAINATFDQLRQQPLSGVAWGSGKRRFSGMRMLPVQTYPTYLFFHRAGPGFVRILYVIHSARDLPTFFAEHPRA